MELLVGVVVFCRGWWVVRAGRQARVASGVAVRGAVLLTAAQAAALVPVPSSAQAEPACGNTWTGGIEGTWQTGSDWSAGHAPTSGEVACIGSGKTVDVTSGANHASVLVDEGTLVISAGSLELGSVLEASSVSALTMTGGALTGAGTLDVSGSLVWKEGEMEGSGVTVLNTGASGTVDAPGVELSERRFTNEGTLTLTAGGIELAGGAVLSNTGTFYLNDNERACEECNRGGLEKGSGSASFTNTGVVEKAKGAGGAAIGVDSENVGTIDGKTGTVVFAGGSNSSTFISGSVLEGAVSIEGASVTAGSFKASSGELDVAGGSLSITGGATATVGVLVMGGGRVQGAGMLKVSETLSWSAGTPESVMSGSGSTILEPGASGSITIPGGNDASFEERALVNEGTLTLSTGHIALSEEARIENRGTLRVNSEATEAVKLTVGGSGKLVNSGTLEKMAGAGSTQVVVPLESSGAVEGRKGQLVFSDGGSSTSTGEWAGSEGGSVALAYGSFTLTGSSWSGAVDLTGATVTAEGVQDHTGHVSVEAGTLTVTGATASTVSDLTLSDGALNGSGTLKITGALEWVSEGAGMAGSGSTILEPGATSRIEVKTPADLQKRSLVNHGTLTWASGALVLSEGAQLSNSSLFYANDNGPSCSELCRRSGVDLGTGSGSFENTGSLIESAGSEAEVEVPFDNEGSVTAETGKLAFKGGGIAGHTATGSWEATGTRSAIEFNGGNYTLGSAVPLAGEVIVSSGEISASDIQGTANLKLQSGQLTLKGPSTSTASGLEVLHPDGKLAGAGTLDVDHSFLWNEGTMKGTGWTVLEPGSAGTMEDSSLELEERRLVNEGTFMWASGRATLSKGAQFDNAGTFYANDAKSCEECSSGLDAGSGSSLFVNTGTVKKTGGAESTSIGVDFENDGRIEEPFGHIEILHPVTAAKETQWGSGGPSAPYHVRSGCGDPVDCATGNFSETQTDLSVPGRGVGMDLTRTYNAQAAVEGTRGPFGYGWTSSFSDHLVLEKSSKKATLYQAEGSTVPFTEQTGGSFTGPEWTQDTLTSGESKYTVTLPDQTKYKFKSSGLLESVTDRNGNATLLTYGEASRLEKITDPAGRKITLKYNSEGLVESAKDPMGHTVKYTYECRAPRDRHATRGIQCAVAVQIRRSASDDDDDRRPGRENQKRIQQLKSGDLPDRPRRTHPHLRIRTIPDEDHEQSDRRGDRRAVHERRRAVLDHPRVRHRERDHGNLHVQRGRRAADDHQRRRVHDRIRVRQRRRPHEHDRPRQTRNEMDVRRYA